MKQIAIRLPLALLDDLDALAKEERRKRSDIIRLTLEDRVATWRGWK